MAIARSIGCTPAELEFEAVADANMVAKGSNCAAVKALRLVPGGSRPGRPRPAIPARVPLNPLGSVPGNAVGKGPNGIVRP